MEPSRRRPTLRRGFTLVELIVAGIIAVIVVATLGSSLSQLARARATCKVRLNAHLRANAALERVRRDIQEIIRSDDLINTRLLLTDGKFDTPVGELERDDVLAYVTRLSPVRGKTYEGDGLEHEVQVRVTDDDYGSALWIRSDAVPDNNEGGGGHADPVMGGIIALNVEAYDGTVWYDNWDSDVDGLPWALRVTVSAGGDAVGEDLYENVGDLMSLRTIIPIDRIVPPYEEPLPDESDPAASPSTDPASTDVAGTGAATDPTAGMAPADIGGGGGAAGTFGDRGRGDGRPMSGGRGGGSISSGGRGAQGGRGGSRGGNGGAGGTRPIGSGSGGP
ncbi:MAG: hypothetical protein EXS17_01385 [Phycisphaerales bacterium]|nr:hypothetical protein [Phycisphaerales bacterium]